MAFVNNAFDLLKGAENQLQASKSKKSKKKQNKQGNEDAPAAVEPSQPSADVRPAANGSSSLHGVVEVNEAVAILERAAREARSVSDKCKLWKDWVRQAGGDRSGKALRFKTANGGQMDFRQVLLTSRALEISIESAVVGPSRLGSDPREEDLLQQLLINFTAVEDSRMVAGIAAALVKLSGLLVDEAPDTRGAAQRAVSALITSLKTPLLHMLESGEGAGGAAADAAAVSAWLLRVTSLDQQIAKQQGLLTKIAATNRGSASKEHASTARTIFQLMQDKFDLVQPEALPSASSSMSSELAAANERGQRALDELRSLVSQRLSQSSASSNSAGVNAGKKAGASDKASLLAGLRKEEAALASQADSVAQQIRTLEAQLRSLRSQQSDIEEQRAQVAQRLRVAADPQAAAAAARGKATPTAAHYQAELSVVDDLTAALHGVAASGTALPDQVAAVSASSDSMSYDLVGVAHQFLLVARSALLEVPQRIAFCKQRISHAEQLSKLSGKDNAKAREDVEALMSDTVKTADELMTTSMQVVAALNARHPAFLRASPEQAAGIMDALQAVDAVVAEVRAAYDTIQAAIRPPQPPPPPPQTYAAAAPVPQPVAVVAPPVVHQQLQPVAAAPAAPVPVAVVVPTPVPVVQQQQQQQAPMAAPVPPQQPAAAGKPKSAFDAATAYLAQANTRPVSAPVRPAANANTARKPSPTPVHVAAGPVAPGGGSAPRQWAKVPANSASAAAAGPSTSADAEDGGALPTPSEAFRGPSPDARGGAAAAAAASNSKRTNRQKA